jgi:hypothetical protein
VLSTAYPPSCGKKAVGNLAIEGVYKCSMIKSMIKSAHIL